mmetsp:Transcript_35120/g.88743  ORF Transcript_35120/g.88743 Transcript_35120/m.88743 type:complete len:259 (+) Transcript_35120:487-1263(+)
MERHFFPVLYVIVNLLPFEQNHLAPPATRIHAHLVGVAELPWVNLAQPSRLLDGGEEFLYSLDHADVHPCSIQSGMLNQELGRLDSRLDVSKLCLHHPLCRLQPADYALVPLLVVRQPERLQLLVVIVECLCHAHSHVHVTDAGTCHVVNPHHAEPHRLLCLCPDPLGAHLFLPHSQAEQPKLVPVPVCLLFELFCIAAQCALPYAHHVSRCLCGQVIGVVFQQDVGAVQSILQLLVLEQAFGQIQPNGLDDGAIGLP